MACGPGARAFRPDRYGNEYVHACAGPLRHGLLLWSSLPEIGGSQGGLLPRGLDLHQEGAVPMSSFVTETGQMERAAKHVNDVDASIQRLLGSLRAEVATAPAHFKGEAARTFATLMDAYDRDAKSLSEALRGISEQLRQSSTAYAARDTERSAALKSSGSGLNM